MKKTPQDRALTLAQAAAYLNVNERTIRNLCATDRDGKARLRHQRIGRTYRFKKLDLDNYGLVETRP